MGPPKVVMGKQEAGIRRLGAFIGASKRMVVLYTNVYTRKLWTVYEVASFLCLHDARDMDMLPVFTAQAVSVCAVGFYIFNILTHISQMSALLESTNISVDVVTYTTYAFGLVAGAPGFFKVRRAFRELVTMQLSVAHFTAQNALCAVESDRCKGTQTGSKS